MITPGRTSGSSTRRRGTNGACNGWRSCAAKGGSGWSRWGTTERRCKPRPAAHRFIARRPCARIWRRPRSGALRGRNLPTPVAPRSAVLGLPSGGYIVLTGLTGRRGVNFSHPGRCLGCVRTPLLGLSFSVTHSTRAGGALESGALRELIERRFPAWLIAPARTGPRE